MASSHRNTTLLNILAALHRPTEEKLNGKNLVTGAEKENRSISAARLALCFRIFICLTIFRSNTIFSAAGGFKSAI